MFYNYTQQLPDNNSSMQYLLSGHAMTCPGTPGDTYFS